MSEMDDAIREFLVESYENLDRLDTEMVQLEERPDDTQILASIFRTIHTIKGTCGFLGYGKLESVTHVGESLLARLREGKLRLDDAIASALLALVDAVRAMLKGIEESGNEGQGDYSELIATLSALKEGRTPSAPSAPATATVTAPAAAPAPAPASAQASTPAPTASTAADPASPSAAPASGSDSAPVARNAEGWPQLGRLLVDHSLADREQIQAALARQKAGDKRQLGEILIDAGVLTREQLADVLAHQNVHRTTPVSDGSVRVDVQLLDRLMNLVGELVLARNQLLQHTSTERDPTLASTTQRLNLVTTELQEGVMKTRMQPVGNVWNKLPRVVRDLAKQTHKEVRLEMEGQETELDRTIIESIKDPLTHIIRNSVDHGIEAPAAREAAGKPREGCIRLRAYHEGGQVNIEIADDGGGINAERVKAKALERGLLNPEQAARLSERELVNLIFLPGFSTAAQVSNISGRGVGMDVVKTNIEKIGGSVDVHSMPGSGTVLKLKIPLTLAIIPGLIVTAAGDRYAIPQVSLLELVRLEPAQVESGIEFVQGVPVHRLRGHLLPLLHLGEELGVGKPEFGAGPAVTIVVLQADGRQFGLVVDDVNDAEEIVVKPLARQLKGIQFYAGATIMGDGRVALILDVPGLAQRAHLVSEHETAGSAAGSESGEEREEGLQTVLLCRAGPALRLAIPLSRVARLEEFPRESLEEAGGRPAVQYRGEIMPLLRLSEVFGTALPAEEEAKLQVVVHTQNGRSLGLVVDQILDIVEDRCVVQAGTARSGTRGAAIVQQKVTEIVDLQALVAAHHPALLESPELANTGAAA